MSSPALHKDELLAKLAEIEKQASRTPGTLDPASAKSAESELGKLFPEICAAAGVPLNEAEESPPWFPPQPPTRAYFLQYARVFLSVVSIADVSGSEKLISKARKTAFETLKGVIAFLRSALL